MTRWVSRENARGLAHPVRERLAAGPEILLRFLEGLLLRPHAEADLVELRDRLPDVREADHGPVRFGGDLRVRSGDRSDSRIRPEGALVDVDLDRVQGVRRRGVQRHGRVALRLRRPQPVLRLPDLERGAGEPAVVLDGEREGALERQDRRITRRRRLRGSAPRGDQEQEAEQSSEAIPSHGALPFFVRRENRSVWRRCERPIQGRPRAGSSLDAPRIGRAHR
jgi:hypothetical protein